jgi:hypothetical protein
VENYLCYLQVLCLLSILSFYQKRSIYGKGARNTCTDIPCIGTIIPIGGTDTLIGGIHTLVGEESYLSSRTYMMGQLIGFNSDYITILVQFWGHLK